jgi:cytochrome c556
MLTISTIRRSPLVAFLLFSGVTALGASIALRADQGPPQGGGAGRAMVPMAASTIARDPASHIGMNVSMMAAVEAIVSKTVFLVDQDKTKATGQPVIVIAPALQTAPDLNAYVTVQGEVIRFDPAEIGKRARGYTLDLPADLVEKYRGQPAVLATAVVTAALVDIAKRPISPPTPTEVAMSQAMKIINSASANVRGGLEKPDPAQMKEQVAALKKAFAEVETLFKSGGPAGATKLASEALTHVTAMEQATGAAKWDEVKAAAGNLQTMCAGCHGQFRDRMDDGTYRIRMGGGQ